MEREYRGPIPPPLLFPIRPLEVASQMANFCIMPCEVYTKARGQAWVGLEVICSKKILWFLNQNLNLTPPLKFQDLSLITYWIV